MIYKPVHIENMFWIFVLKQIQFTWKLDVSFFGQYMLLGQNLEPDSVLVLDDCKCERLQPENNVYETSFGR